MFNSSLISLMQKAVSAPAPTQNKCPNKLEGEEVVIYSQPEDGADYYEQAERCATSLNKEIRKKLWGINCSAVRLGHDQAKVKCEDLCRTKPYPPEDVPLPLPHK